MCSVSMGSKVVSTSSSNSRLINWDNGSIGVSYKTSIRSISSSISNRASSSINSAIDSLGGKMISTGSSNSRLIDGSDSSIRVGNKLCVQVEGTSITSISNSNWSSSNSRGYCNSWGSSNNGCSGSISSSLRCKVVSTGSSNCWFIKRNNSSIGMGNELCIKVKWASISITSSISCSISCSIGISGISSNN